ncbi:MAG TPA: DUF1501 domain-containing protein [Planktothrix sp.]|jgi:uncharacterized protein (DUF1501 family)
MDRRTFLKSAATYSLSMLLPGAQAWAFSNATGSNNNKKLVVVFLRGAADGLNILVPYADPAYYQARSSIAIPQPGAGDNSVLNLDGSWGLHPALSAMMPMWQSKSLAFVAASGSPDPTRSHFDAQDYMESGVPGAKVISTGWMNRLVSMLPDNHSPLRAINVGPTIPRILAGPASVANMQIGPAAGRKMAVDRPAIAQAFQELYADRKDVLGEKFREGMEARQKLSKELEDEMEQANRGAPAPKQNPDFGKQLAKLLTKDPTVQVAFVAFGGWDTHVNQGAGKGQLANHLQPLGNGLADLVQGLGPMYDDTTIVVMSEFGRTAHENGNGGTDHGHGNMMWLMGGGVRGGKVYGKYDSLASSDLYEGRDLPVSTDFRNVLASVLVGHMGLESSQMEKVFPHFNATNGDVANIVHA